ncbi:MAG: VOC family protein [Bacteroidia bacterium]|nr:VOC family protein [Bacteroidia bacterium]MCX7651389.1 VOC family protein [Bacteroidia bacterium]MDW8416711.1 VOC family protein [Bacteroidia bacterium]
MPDTNSSKPASLSHIKETCLYIQNTQRTRAFYEGILGLPCIAELPERFVFFRVGADMLLCFIPEFSANNPILPTHWATGPQHLAFETPDYQNWKAYLQQQGVAIEHEAVWQTGRRSFYFRDPDGHSIEIVEPGIWGDVEEASQGETE